MLTTPQVMDTFQRLQSQDAIEIVKRGISVPGIVVGGTNKGFTMVGEEEDSR